MKHAILIIFLIFGINGVHAQNEMKIENNKMIQDYVKKMQEAGIKVEACMACARMYEVDGKLQELGIDVKGMGIPLSNYLKDGWKTLSL